MFDILRCFALSLLIANFFACGDDHKKVEEAKAQSVEAIEEKGVQIGNCVVDRTVKAEKAVKRKKEELKEYESQKEQA